jgi:hypothetical protein
MEVKITRGVSSLKKKREMMFFFKGLGGMKQGEGGKWEKIFGGWGV